MKHISLAILSGLITTNQNVQASGPAFNNSRLYDLGLYGPYPHLQHVTVDFEAPRVNIKQWDTSCDDGQYILLTPRGTFVPTPGPMLLDNRGNLVWSGSEFGMVSDLKVQEYAGEKYLTFWSGRDDGTHGYGVYYMLNSSYDIVHTIKPHGDILGDLHEFSITPKGTALITIYGEPEQANLSSFNRPSHGWIIDSLFQELDIATSTLLFSWRASDHYNISDTLAPIRQYGYTASDPFDYFHINSIDKDPAGTYYISSRYMHTITAISPLGTVLWKLGGPNSSFTDISGGAASNFAWQHHMRMHPGNLVTVFDNGAFNALATASHSRALLIHLNTTAMTAELVQAYTKTGVRSHSQGSVQLLPESGHVFVGWGHTPAYTEFAANGTVLCDVHFGPSFFFNRGWAKSYRVVKAHWVGRPRTKLVAKMGRGDRVYISWNGATEVVGWRVEVWLGVGEGREEDVEGWEVVREVARAGFETSIAIAAKWRRRGRWLRIAAMDRDGNILGTSNIVEARWRRGGHWGMALLIVVSVVLALVLAAKKMRMRGRRLVFRGPQAQRLLQSGHTHEEECVWKQGRME